MTRFQTVLAATAALFAFPALCAAEGIEIHDAYAISSGKAGATGAIFMTVHNHGTVDDQLIGAASDVAAMVQLHTHIEDANGVMQMRHVPDGFAVPAGGEHLLARGGDHVMLMGLTRDLAQGDVISLTLTFAQAGDVVIDVAVDNMRKADAMGHSGHAMPAAGGHAMQGAMTPDTAGLSDTDAITAILKAQFDTPDSPLSVDPVVVQGDNALASWAQGEAGGRALLARRDRVWTVVLCGGPDLRLPAFLASQGVMSADSLSQMFNAAEDALGAEKVALSSSFEGVMLISPAPAN